MLYESLLCCHREFGSLQQQYQSAQQGFNVKQQRVNNTVSCRTRSSWGLLRSQHLKNCFIHNCYFLPVSNLKECESDGSKSEAEVQAKTKSINGFYNRRCQTTVEPKTLYFADFDSLPRSNIRHQFGNNVHHEFQHLSFTDHPRPQLRGLRSCRQLSEFGTQQNVHLVGHANHINSELHGNYCWRDPRYGQQNFNPKSACSREILIHNQKTSGKLISSSGFFQDIQEREENHEDYCGPTKSVGGSEFCARAAAEQKRIAVRSCCRSISPMPKRAGTASGTSAKASSNKIFSSTSSSNSSTHKKIKTEHKSGW